MTNKLEVYDGKNPDRFLGYLIVPEERLYGKSFNLALVSRADPYFDNKFARPADRRLCFDIKKWARDEVVSKTPTSEVRMKQIWKVCVTDAALEDLMDLNRFMLPGEDEMDAEERRRIY